MNKILSYIVVSATKNISLGEIVSENLVAGFQPYCAPYLDRNGIEKQAMVTYEEVKPESKPKKKGKAKDEN